MPLEGARTFVSGTFASSTPPMHLMPIRDSIAAALSASTMALVSPVERQEAAVGPVLNLGVEGRTCCA